MIIYYVFMTTMLGTYYLYQANKSSNLRKLFCILSSFFVFLLFAFRDTSVGMYDVEQSYTQLFYTLADKPYSYIFEKYTSDYLFYIFTKAVTFLTSNINIYLAISALPIVCATGILIYKYSVYPWMSWLMFFCLGYFSVHATIMRQSIAMALSLFMYMEALKGQYKKAVLFWIIASGFHITAIISIVPVILQKTNIKLNLKSICILLGTSILCFIFSDSIFDFAFSKITFERFNRYSLHLSSFNTTLFLINLLQCFFCVVVYYFLILKNTKHNGETDGGELGKGMESQLLLTILCSLPFYALTKTLSDIYRIGLYFSQFAIIAVPNSSRKVPAIIRVIVIFALIVIYYYYGAVRGFISVTPYRTIF